MLWLILLLIILLTFSILQVNTSSIDVVIPNLVTTNMHNILTSLPSNEDVWCVIFGLNKNSASGLDSFDGFSSILYGILFNKMYVFLFCSFSNMAGSFLISTLVTLLSSLSPKRQPPWICLDLFPCPTLSFKSSPKSSLVGFLPSRHSLSLRTKESSSAAEAFVTAFVWNLKLLMCWIRNRKLRILL